jgi:DNA-binding protein HU-beta
VPSRKEDDLMNMTELAQNVSERAGVPPKDALKAVKATVDAIVSELARGGRVYIRKFGAFSVRDRAERRCRHPQTGAVVSVPPRRSARFRASRCLADIVRKAGD